VAVGSFVFAFISSASIGLFILPFASFACWFVSRRARWWPESLGGFVGAGVVFLLIAYINRGYVPCPEGPVTMRLRPDERFSCGGFDPLPWLFVGAILVSLGLAGYFAFASASRREP
jgi:hypothetical protein